MDERARVQEEKEALKLQAAERKKHEIEENMRVRKEKRERSLQEMAIRTRQVTSGIALRPSSLADAQDPVRQSAAADMPANLPKLQGVLRPGGGARSKSGLRESADDVQLMRKNSQKYDDVVKGRKEELRRKRGALDMNSDLDVELKDNSITQQNNESLLVSQNVENQGPPINFRSKLHDDIKKQEREAKEKQKKDLAER